LPRTDHFLWPGQNTGILLIGLFIDPFCKNARVWKRQALGGLLGLGTSPARMIRWPRRSVATRFGSKHLAALGGAIFKKEAASNRIAFVIGWRRSPILPLTRATKKKAPRWGAGPDEKIIASEA
jgi:hypothetical protein